MGKGMTLDEEIQRDVKRKRIVLDRVAKEDKRLSGETVMDGKYIYDTTAMFGQVLERNYGKWLDGLSQLTTVEEQDRYYRTVIYPHINYLENRIEYRHSRYRHVSLHGDDTPDTDDDSADYDRDSIENLPCVVDFDDRVFTQSPDTLHELVTDPALSFIIENLTEEQKYILYCLAVSRYSNGVVARIKGTTERNVRKTRDTALTHIRGQYLPVVMFKYRVQSNGNYRWLYLRGISTSHWERLFVATIGENYTDYYGGMSFDFVGVTKDYRAWDRRDRDWVAKWNDIKRRRKRQAEAKNALHGQSDDGKITVKDSSYMKGRG